MKKARLQLWLQLGALGMILVASVFLMLWVEHSERARENESEGHKKAISAYRGQETFSHAQELFAAGDLKAAGDLLQRVMYVFHDRPEAWQLQGAIYFRQGNFVQAERAFRYVLHLAPNYAAGCNNLAQTLLVQGKDQDALEMVQKAVRLEPDNGEICFNSAKICAKLKQDNEALVYLKKALQQGVFPEDIVQDPEIMELMERMGPDTFLKLSSNPAEASVESTVQP